MAALTANDFNAVYKNIFAKKIIDLVPSCTKLLKALKFNEGAVDQGGYFIQPVILAPEQGITYLPPNATDSTLYGNINMNVKFAQVLGGQQVWQCQMNVEAASRAKSRGEAAFENAVKLQMVSVADNAKKRLEIGFLYGGTPIATVHANTTVNGNQRLTITSAEWSSGIWAAMSGARFDAYTAGGTLLNQNPLTVVTSNAAQTSVLFTGNAGDLANVSGNVNASADTVQLWFYKAKGNESTGIKYQLSTVGSVFGIDNSLNDLWRGTTFDANGAPLIFGTIQDAIAVPVGRGGLDEDVNVYLNPDSWADLNTDQAAMRRYTVSSKTYETGAEELKFHGQNGTYTLIPHIYVKSGDCFILPMDKVNLIGVNEFTFDVPGTEKGQVFIQQFNNFSFEYRGYSQEQVFIDAPAKCVYVSNIVSTIVN